MSRKQLTAARARLADRALENIQGLPLQQQAELLEVAAALYTGRRAEVARLTAFHLREADAKHRELFA